MNNIHKWYNSLSNLYHDSETSATGFCLRTAFIFWAIANNGLSILENAAHLGLPVPEQLKDVLEQLHNRETKSGEPETVIREEIDK